MTTAGSDHARRAPAPAVSCAGTKAWPARGVEALLASLTICVLCIPACQSTSPRPSDPFSNGHWVLVRRNPPTWFPKGVPPDHPTGHRDGFWVAAGDAAGTQFFVPVRGSPSLDRDQLIAEAYSAATPAKRRELTRGRVGGGLIDVGSTAVENTIKFIQGLAIGLGR